jgi:S1-C subfamily serine protease
MLSASALALSPDQIFERGAPGVWLLRALDLQDRPLSTGSAVVVAPGRVVTSCQLLARAQKIELRQGNYVFKAVLEFPDVERDLCQLQVSGLAAAALTRGPARSLRVGHRIYIVGHMSGGDQSLNEGLVSSLHDAEAGAPQILTSIAAARGLLGGAVLDGDGRLVGVVAASPKNAAGTAFAVPTEWLDDIEGRAKSALESRRSHTGASTSNAPASPTLPAPGATYRYAWVERQYSRQLEYTVKVTAVQGWNVSESFAVQNAAEYSAAVSARDLSFVGRRLADGQSLLEFAPYLPVWDPGEMPALPESANYPTGGHEPWSITMQPPDWDPVVVPAGAYRALRIQIRGSRKTYTTQFARANIAERFEFTAWYSPELKRYVKLRHRMWNGFRSDMGDENVELLEYRAN